MTIVDWLTKANSSYLVALAVTVYLIVEGVKVNGVPAKWLPLVASLVGVIMGLIIGLIYQESLIMTCLDGFIAGLLAAGSYDWLKTVWQLPEGGK